MRTAAADRSHNTTQRNTNNNNNKSVRQLLSSSSSSSSSSSFFCSSRTRRASPAGSKKRCACCCPTAWWCLPACLRPKLCRLATSGNVSSSAGWMAPPKLAGERPTETSEGFTFRTPVLGREVIRCPGTWTRRISGGDCWEVFFLGFPE